MLDSNVAQGQNATRVKVRIAAANRAVGKYKDALSMLTEVLKTQNMQLGVQIEAAYTYQEWALKLNDEKSRLTQLNRAMRGGELDSTKKKYIVWGWGKTARLTGSNKKFRNQFHEARYNYAKCRFEAGKATTDRSKQRSLYELAEKDIRVVVQLYPDMGGNVWRPRYDQLAREVQKSLGKTAVGLKAYEPKKDATAAD